MRPLSLVVPGLLLLLTAPKPMVRTAHASSNGAVQQPAPAVSTSGEAQRRVVVRASLFSGILDFAGLSLGVRPLPIPVDLELGAGVMPFVGAYGYARLGSSAVLMDHRDAYGRGLVLELPAMLGVELAEFSCCGNTREFQAADLIAGLELFRWYSPRFAFSLRLIGGAAVGRGRDRQVAGQDLIGRWERQVVPIARLSVGLAF